MQLVLLGFGCFDPGGVQLLKKTSGLNLNPKGTNCVSRCSKD